jgi:hypothetical protein
VFVGLKTGDSDVYLFQPEYENKLRIKRNAELHLAAAMKMMENMVEQLNAPFYAWRV